jgi:hypothetical protein
VIKARFEGFGTKARSDCATRKARIRKRTVPLLDTLGPESLDKELVLSDMWHDECKFIRRCVCGSRGPLDRCAASGIRGEPPLFGSAAGSASGRRNNTSRPREATPGLSRSSPDPGHEGYAGQSEYASECWDRSTFFRRRAPCRRNGAGIMESPVFEVPPASDPASTPWPG